MRSACTTTCALTSVAATIRTLQQIAHCNQLVTNRTLQQIAPQQTARTSLTGPRVLYDEKHTHL